jgi:Ca2+-binding EF-hand superfamily protein
MSIQGLGQSSFAYQSMNMSKSQSTDSSSFDSASIESIMESDDANQDGVLTIDETPMSEDMFADADTDSSGDLSSEELEEVFSNDPPPMGPPPPSSETESTEASELEALLAEEDTDGDGSISAEETSLASEIFSQLDLDEDGLLSQDEIQQGMDEHEARMSSSEGTSQTSLTQSSATQAYAAAMESIMTNLTGSYDDSVMSSFMGAIA